MMKKGVAENKSDDGNLQEIWKKANDSTFLGESYFIKEEDTIHFETIILQQNGEELKYNTTIKGQNNDEPVTFIEVQYGSYFGEDDIVRIEDVYGRK